MGGRGSASGLIRPGPKSSQQTQPSQVAQQAPDANNTPVQINATTRLSNMTDFELTDLVRDSQIADMPNMLSDIDDDTQKFVYTAGVNEKATVLDDAQFDQFMRDNNISQSQVLSRSVKDIQYKNKDGTVIKMSADRVSRMIKDSRFNYIGGKKGGQLYGAGTYFDMNGGGNTGYGSQTINAVLNPKTAKVITDRQLRSAAQSFAQSHPNFNRVVGGYRSDYKGGKNNMSIWALAMGYNVIKDSSSGYHNVIDRSALVIRRNDR
ncbi:MAG: hypothetical protein LIP12_00190 [Clostridiales bacterium]|nr:hypothetical protein [Clostridiales bacterium]